MGKNGHPVRRKAHFTDSLFTEQAKRDALEALKYDAMKLRSKIDYDEEMKLPQPPGERVKEEDFDYRTGKSL